MKGTDICMFVVFKRVHYIIMPQALFVYFKMVFYKKTLPLVLCELMKRQTVRSKSIEDLLASVLGSRLLLRMSALVTECASQTDL